MDKEKFEKMFEMMKGCCTDEKGMANCCAMMMKMMQFGVPPSPPPSPARGEGVF